MTCWKNAYRSRSDARRAARASSTRFGNQVLEYRCPDCGKWHVGHDKTRGTRKCHNCGAPIRFVPGPEPGTLICMEAGSNYRHNASRCRRWAQGA